MSDRLTDAITAPVQRAVIALADEANHSRLGLDAVRSVEAQVIDARTTTLRVRCEPGGVRYFTVKVTANL